MPETDPRWLTLARQNIGVREIVGPQHSPVIRGWLQKLNAWWSDDETPWCGVFVGYVLAAAGAQIPQAYYRARAWLEWGQGLEYPRLGCIVVFERGPKNGHVGFLVGKDELGRLMILGGNQGNAVSVAPFMPDRVLGYRWPVREEIPYWAELPMLALTGQASRNEA